jgi:cytochrome c oxidase subunit 2
MLDWLPENVSTYGGDIDFLFYLIYYITAAVFVLVAVTLVVFLVLYRRREGRRASYTHGSTALEITWTTVTLLIMITLALMSRSTWARIKQTIPPSDVVVQITGRQFAWDVVYPGPDGVFETEDDLVMENELHVPVGKVVRVVLASKDVIHSLFLPNLRFKQDAVPGRQIAAWFEVTKPGRYEIACAELCGFGHYTMRGWLNAHPPDEYEAWVKENWPSE